MTKTQLNEKLRATVLPRLIAMFEADSDVCRIASNKIAIPAVDDEGTEKWITITVSVPNESEFDGYNEAQFYAEKLKAKAAKAEEKAAAAAKRQKEATAKRAEKGIPELT